MNNSYQNEADAPLEDNSVSASLVIYVDAEGGMGFECEWDEGVESVASIGAVFYKLLEEDLTTDILRFLEQQCVIQERTDEYEAILQSIHQLKLLKEANKSSGGDYIVISPSDAAKM